LNASHNAIIDIDSSMFTDLGNLRHLDLSFNHLIHVASDFSTMPLLKTIKLHDNELQSIEDTAFKDLRLLHLDLSCNRLSSDNFLWSETLEIAYLNLSFNAFSELNASVLENVVVTDLYGEHAEDDSWQRVQQLPSTHSQRIHLHASGLRRKFSPRKMFTTAGIMW
jgi:Leucine-rich repeat (LRR) protein